MLTFIDKQHILLVSESEIICFIGKIGILLLHK